MSGLLKVWTPGSTQVSTEHKVASQRGSPRRDQHRPVPCVSGYSVRDALATFRMPLLVPSLRLPCLGLTTSLMWTSAIPMRVFICGHTWILPEHATKAVLHVLILYTRGFLVHFHSANGFAGFPQRSETHLGLSHSSVAGAGRAGVPS